MILIWCFIMIAALIIEIATVGTLVSIWFTIGAAIALVLALLNVPDIIQVVVFALTSGILILSLRPLAAKYFRGNIVATNADSLIGKHAKLIRSITEDQYGEIKWNDVVWNAVSIDGKSIEQNTLVSIQAIEGAKLIVKEID